MRVLLQRVSRASVAVDGVEHGAVGRGFLALVGVPMRTTPPRPASSPRRRRALRVFADAAGHMNEALGEREILCVSQFTLYGETRRGNRPSFIAAAPAEQGIEPLYERLACERAGGPSAGVFGAHMQVELVNDGPVTLLLEATP